MKGVRVRGPQQGPPANLLVGVVRLAFFNTSGFAAIGNTVQAYLASLAPLVAFVLVGSALVGKAHGWQAGLGNLLQSVCVLTGQAVLSHFIATRWGRADRWLRYAAAWNWSQLVIPVVGALFVLVMMVAGSTGPSPRSLAYMALGGVAVYALTLQVFLACKGLELVWWRAVVLVVLVACGLAVILALPTGALRLVGGAAHAGAGLPV